MYLKSEFNGKPHRKNGTETHLVKILNFNFQEVKKETARQEGTGAAVLTGSGEVKKYLQYVQSKVKLILNMRETNLKVHKIEIFFGFDFEICIISLLVMSKY
jgi:hypothetical protein